MAPANQRANQRPPDGSPSSGDERSHGLYTVQRVALALGILAFGGGTWLLVESVEGLVKAVRGWAVAAGLSGMVLAALVLGFDVESTAAGVAATLDGLPGTALGTSVGATTFLMTAGLGIAALVAPFSVAVPKTLLAVAAGAAAVPAALMLDGELSRLDGGILVAAFVPLFAALLRTRRDAPPGEAAGGAEPRSDVAAEQVAGGAAPRRAGDAEPRSGAAAETVVGGAERPDRLPLRLALALAGVLIGAELLVFGTQRIVDGLEISETLFGLIVVAVAVSLEEIVLEALPAYRGFPELAVGNALGTLVFLLTASLGIIALVRPLTVPDGVLDYHLPALLISVALALCLLARGRLGRPVGALMVGGYAAYAALAVVLSP